MQLMIFSISNARSLPCKLDKPIYTDLTRLHLNSKVKKTESMSDNLVANTMLEAEKEVKKTETMESYAWIRTADGSIYEVEREVVMLWPTIGREMKSGIGSSQNNPISLHPRVKPTSLCLVIDYCRFHRAHHSCQEHKTFDEYFLQMDARGLCELLNVANYLQLGPLLNSTKKAMAQKISNKSTEEIWHLLHLADDLPEAAKLKLHEYSIDDPRRRLLKKYYSKNKKSIEKIIENLKDLLTGVKPRQREDTRDIDDLVSFINGGDGDTKGVKTSKKKKNRKKRKEQKKTSSNSTSSTEASTSKKVIEMHDGVSHMMSIVILLDVNASDSANHSTVDTLELLGTRDESFDVAEDNSVDDLVPAYDEKTDREVIEFAVKLNLDPTTIY